MRRIALFGLLFGIILTSGRASAQPILFNHCFGGSNADEFTSVIQTSDGGFACTGYSRSNNDDLTANFGGPDVWVVKLNSAGGIQWKKSFGGSGVDSANCIYETSDNYLLIAGMTSSTDSGITGNHGNGDAWVIKLDLNGNLQWQKVYGGSNLDVANAIVENSSTGDYVFCGSTLSNDGDVSGNHGGRDIWVVDINTTGTLQWKKCFGGSNDESGYDIIATSDGGTMVCGQTKSYDGNVTGDHTGQAGDAWLVKLSSSGALQWEHCYGGTQEESANSIVQRADGGYTFAGRAGSTDGDVVGLHFQIDAWVVSVNSSGTMLWQHALGGHFDDEAYSIFQTTDNGYLIGGQTGSNDGDAVGNHGGGDAWILKLDSVGNLSWQHCLGGMGTDQANSVIQAQNGKYFMAGFTGSNDGDISNNHGSNDALLVEFGNPDPPIIDYITPDAGAPGMCVAVEMVGPVNATQNFGDDQYYSPDVPNTNDLIVTFPRPSDSLLVQLGPYAVSWNGRLLQQMFLINPHTAPIDTEIYFQVNWQGQASAIDSFLVVTPTHFAPMTGSGTIPTTGRTKRNTLVIDSMVLSNGTYTFSQTDPDAATPGNQSYLPVRILSMGPVRLSGAVLKVDGQNGATSSAGGNGGPGGGGGGAGYPGKGGDGFTGGGGDNDGSNGPGGAGTGVPAPTAWNGGYSLNGVPGGLGEQHTSGGGDDGGGGGTGHPFGTSGTNGNNTTSPNGGIGAGSAGGSTSNYTSDYGGGGGGYAFAGAQGQGTGNNGGLIVGNPMIVPFAGGSGGGGGNQTYVSLFGGAGGPGGGGGGAIDVTSFASFSMGNGDVEATGGTGGNGNHSIEPAAAGGGGSGGAVSISARDSVVIFSSASLNVAGGAAGTSSSNNGGAGGAGRIRINGFASKSASASSNNFFPTANSATGPSIQKVTFLGDSVYITGFDQFWDATPSGSPNIDLYYLWPSSGGDWGDTTVVWVPNAGSHSASWKSVLPISPNAADTVLYLVAMHTESDSIASPGVEIPPAFLSHTSGIIAHVVGPPKDSVYPGKIDFGDVLLGACSNDTLVTVYSIGHSELSIDSAKLLGKNNSQFRIKTGFPIPVNPGTSTKITLAFCPDSLICPMTATLVLYTNAGDTTIILTGCAVQPQMVIHPLVLNFGRVHIGNCKDSSVVVSNPGKDPLTISSETIFGAQFQALDSLPMIVPAGDSDTIRIRFCPSDTALALGSDTVRSDAPQSPIGVQLLGEGKVGILSIDSIIDFGLVHLDSCKDIVVYARNTGNDSLILESGLVASSGFTPVSPVMPITIAAGDSAPIDIRFCATDVGTFEATAAFTTDIPSTRIVDLLAHVGIGILQMPTTIDFGNVTVGGCKDTLVAIRNIGTDTLFLAAGTNFQTPFSYIGPAIIVLAPGASTNITFQFCPQDSNEASETTQFDTIGHGKDQNFTLLGNGVEGTLSTSGPIDIGCIALGSSATVSVKLTNTGAATLQNIVPSATPPSNVTIVHNPPTSLGAGGSDSVVMIVSPTTLGLFSGTLTLSSSSAPVTVPITAEVSTPPAIVSLDTIVAFDSTNTGDSSVVKCVTIVNYSCVELSLSSVVITGPDTSDFEILSITGGPELSDSIPATICLRYTPKQGGSAFGVLTGISNGTTVSLATLTGTGVGKSVAVELAVDTVAGVPGQVVNVPVRTRNDVTAGSITTVDFRVVFDPMQLDLKAPIAPATWGIESSLTPTYQLIQHSIGDKEFIATFPTPLTGKPVIANLPFEILEPISNTAAVHLMSATFGTSNSTLASTSDGLVQIEQCDTNSRLTFVPPAIDVAPNDPNPFSSLTHVSVTVHTAGHVKIEIYNALGSKVLVPFDGDVQLGTQSIPIDATPLAPGAYRYVTTWTWPSGTPLPAYQAATVRIEHTMIVLGE